MPPFPSILVCSIEKAFQILLDLIDTNRVNEIGAVIIDEVLVHYNSVHYNI